MIFEAKRRNAGICGTCHKWLAIWTFISAGRRVTQVSKKLLSACAVNRFCSSRVEKKIRKYDFQSSQANIHPAIFSSSRSFSARVLLATQRPQTPTRQRYDAMSNCKPKSTFLVHLLVFLVEHGHWSPFLKQSTHLRTLHFTHLRTLTHRRTHAPNLTHLRIPSSYRTTFQPSM